MLMWVKWKHNWCSKIMHGHCASTVQAIANLAEVPITRDAALPRGEKEPILKEALDWNEPKSETVDEPTLQS